MKKSQKQHQSAPESGYLLHRADAYAQGEPARAVATAFGAGFLLNLLPLGAIASGLIAVAFSLVRPALLVLGLFKATALWRAHQASTSNHE